jgi:hypothetical protein
MLPPGAPFLADVPEEILVKIFERALQRLNGSWRQSAKSVAGRAEFRNPGKFL